MGRVISENGLSVLLATRVSWGQESCVDDTTSDIVGDLDVLAWVGEVVSTDRETGFLVEDFLTSESCAADDLSEHVAIDGDVVTGLDCDADWAEVPNSVALNEDISRRLDVQCPAITVVDSTIGHRAVTHDVVLPADGRLESVDLGHVEDFDIVHVDLSVAHSEVLFNKESSDDLATPRLNVFALNFDIPRE
jgi:hypothetical protein